MRKHARLTIIAVLIAILAAGAAPLRAQLQEEAGFIPVDGSVSYFHVGSYFNRVTLRTSPARMWYVFQPADEDAASKPLLVFFNGGPGGATSCGLLAAFTGRNAIWRNEVTGDSAIIANPASWTRIGNLLHIDSRTAGFSYSLMDGPGDAVRRGREFDAQNYNSFVDGADFVRFLLKFLAEHPSIRGNRVVLVPESYGGTRTIVMLNLLLYYMRYADGSAVYQDPGLVGAIRAHYDAVFPGYVGQTVPPAVIAGQFGHQVLIQTALTWSYQKRVAAEMLEEPGSPIYQVAAETGVPYVLYKDSPGAVPDPTPSQVLNYLQNWLISVGRDAYHMAKPSDFFNGHRAAAEAYLTHIDTLNLMTGIDVSGVPWMYASAREDAYKMRIAGTGGVNNRTAATASRVISRTDRRGDPAKPSGPTYSAAEGRNRASRSGNGRPPANLDFSALVGPPPDQKKLAAWFAPSGEADMAAVFGSLQPWDRFFIGLNYDASSAFAYNKATLRNYPVQYNNSTLYGRMFLENVAWVETFATDAAWDSVVYSAALPEALALHADILSGAQLDAAGPPGAARPGQILLSYRPSTIPGSSVTARTIRFPGYLLSGHAVTLTEPMEILDDVIDWLAVTGIPVRGR